MPDEPQPTSETLIGGVEKREMVIVGYDPDWPAKFQEHAARISSALGAKALDIQHVGSTSVPGLAAKPIIDIVVTVADSGDEAAYLPASLEAGYVLRVREPDWHQHRMLRTPELDVHIHFYSTGCEEITRLLAFREHLRRHDDERGRYVELKRKLAQQEWSDMNAYAQAKTAFIEDIIARARKEASLERAVAFMRTQPQHADMTVEKLREMLAKVPKTPQERYERAMEALQQADSSYARWCALGKAAKTAVEIGKDEEAEAYALELQQMVPEHQNDWNYGNAIQDFNLVLGHLCLRRGDAEGAKEHLLAAGRSPGSPQMDSFGPNLSLAKALLEAGHKEVVLEYFELCRRFWAMDNGRLNQWADEVNAGQVPKFGTSLWY